MSVIQNKVSELRYLRRKNLDEEAKLVGNWYRDIIRSYGVDVNYYKLNTNMFGDYKGTVDQNILLQHAYGYDVSPDYSMSAQMLSYMEVEQDIFQINKFGTVPDANVTFYFDSNDFACALAEKLGQYKEVKIDETYVECEIPEITDKVVVLKDCIEHKPTAVAFLSADSFPYKLGFGRNEFYCADMLSGKFQVDIPWYEFDKEQTIACDAYEHTLLSSAFKANPTLYKTFYHNYQNKEYLDTMLFLTFKVNKTVVDRVPKKLKAIFPLMNVSDIEDQLECCYDYLDVKMAKYDNFNIKNIVKDLEYLKRILHLAKCNDADYLDGSNLGKVINELHAVMDECKKMPKMQDVTRCILKGKLHGSVLFYDLNKIGKYLDKIHPEVGDVITIDFPDENNREQYEITDAFDKSLQSDGISPLLHKYIWKCSARRRIDNYNNIEQNEADGRLEEKIKLEQIVQQDITDKISIYDDEQDAVYGGYGNVISWFDSHTIDNEKQCKYQYIEDGTAIDIMQFSCGSKIATTGYDLLFIDADGIANKITLLDKPIFINGDGAYAESNIKYLKASDSQVVFQNILGDTYTVASDYELNDGKMTLQLDSLYDKTFDDQSINSMNDNFYKFKSTRTYLFATAHHLFCKLASNEKTFQIC